MRRILILLLIFLSACAPTPQVPQVSWRYLALGDSYTIGEGVDGSAPFPAQLVQGVGLEGFLLDYEVIARSGWTSQDLMAAVDERAPQGPFDLVTLLVGVNDQFRGHAPEDYRAQFRAMLEKAIALAGSRAERVVVISIPDWGVSPFGLSSGRTGIAQEIDAFNAVNLAEAQAAGARYVDITSRSRELSGEKFAFAADGLHPSAAQYSAWVELILPEAIRALQDE